MDPPAEKISVSMDPGVLSLGRARHTGPYRFSRNTPDRRWLFSCLLRGTIRTTTAQGQVETAGFCLRMIRPEVVYHVNSTDGSSYWCFFLPQPSWEPLLHWPERLPGVMYLDVGAGGLRRSILRLLAEAARLNSQSHPHRHRLLANALERILLLADAINPASAPGRMDDRVRQALAYIGSHLRENLSLAAMARAVHLSPSHLAHLFEQEMGMSPKRYHHRQRMEAACELLRHTGLPVKQIAREMGFANPYHFSRRFRHFADRSPRQYRDAINRA